jgi:ribosomal protein L6P/L9E
MYYKLKYSSLIQLTKKNSVLYLKGPLGINQLKIPQEVKVILGSQNRILIGSDNKSKKTANRLASVLRLFLNSCYGLVFGHLTTLNIQGLGLKFLELNPISIGTNCLSMTLGYANPVNFFININCLICFFKDNRNIYFYSTDYGYLSNQSVKLSLLKRPNKFHKRTAGLYYLNNFI